MTLERDGVKCNIKSLSNLTAAVSVQVAGLVLHLHMPGGTISCNHVGDRASIVAVTPYQLPIPYAWYA